MAYDKKSHTKYYQTQKGRYNRIFYEIKSRAKKRGLAFDLDQQGFKPPAVCPALGIPLFFSIGEVTDNTPTIDRINNTKGYTKDNCEWLSYRANRIKNSSTLEELISITLYVAKRQK